MAASFGQCGGIHSGKQQWRRGKRPLALWAKVEEDARGGSRHLFTSSVGVVWAGVAAPCVLFVRVSMVNDRDGRLVEAAVG